MTKYVYHYCAEYRIVEFVTRFSGIATLTRRVNESNYNAIKEQIIDYHDLNPNLDRDKLEIISLSFLHEIEEE